MSFQLFKELEAIKEEMMTFLSTEDRLKIEKLWKEKVKEKPPLSILLYGVYNAGKSTLINAIVGEKIAEMGIVPTTKKLHFYSWKDFVVFIDAPGKDAVTGEDFEKVTPEDIFKSDVVLFVLTPDTQLDEKWIWEAIKNLKEFQKPLFLVINEKFPISEEDEKRILEKILAECPEFAESKFFFGPFFVNAKRGFDGKIENDELKLEKSGISQLEECIIHSAKKIEGFARLNSLLYYLKESILKKELEKIHTNMEKFSKPYAEISKSLTLLENEISGFVKGKLIEEKASLEEYIRSGVEYVISNSCIEELEEKIGNFAQNFEDEVSKRVENINKLYILEFIKRLSEISPSIGKKMVQPPEKKKQENHKQQVDNIPFKTSYNEKSETFSIQLPFDKIKTLPIFNVGDKELEELIKDIIKIKPRPKTVSPQKWAKEVSKRVKVLGKLIKTGMWLLTLALTAVEIYRNLKTLKEKEEKEREIRSKASAYFVSTFKMAVDNELDSAYASILEHLRENIRKLKEKYEKLEKMQSKELDNFKEKQKVIENLIFRIESLCHSIAL
jgi:GTPase Era involved in 16S rRNA processing